MKNRILTYSIPILLILFIGQIGFAQRRTREPRVNIEDFTGTEEEANIKIETLNNLISEAEAKGIDATKEKMAIRLAKIFLFYANWDEDNKPFHEEHFERTHEFYESSVETIAENLPDFERSEVIIVLDNAIVTLNKLINGEISRKPTPQIDWSQITYKNNKQVYDGKPVFLADYTWQPEKAGPHDISTYFGDYGDFYMDPAYVQNEQGNITQWVLNNINNSDSGNFGIAFIGTRIPDWLETKYPNIRTGKTLYIAYDISNPGSKEVTSKLFEGVIPLIKDKKYVEQGYMLANEPHWNLAGNWETVELSDHARDSLRVWLQNKHSKIADLNTLWGKNYSSFDDVDVTIPMPLNEQGKPMWYDVMRFNQERVINWFTYLHNEVKKHDPEAKTHIKLIPLQWSGEDRFHGLDFEVLTSITDHIGNDAGAKNSFIWGPYEDWEDRYDFSWRSMSMMYDFFRSVSPNKINYNSEAHFLQEPAFTDLFLEPNYVRSVYWLATIQGMSSSQTWYWPRDESGQVTTSHGSTRFLAGSAINQPRVVHEIASTMMDLNTFSEHIDALQHLKQPIRIFYSETSAINKLTQMDDIFDMYESLYFEGISIGFATEKIIKKQNNSLWEVVIVNNTQFVTKAELLALQDYLDQGGTIILDAVSLKKDEYGRNHNINLNTNKGGTIISGSSVTDITTKALNLANSKGSFSNVTLTETNSLGLKGCVWRAYKSPQDENIVNIINVGKETATVELGLKDTSKPLVAINLLTGERLDANFSIEPSTVYLLSLRERTAEDNRYTIAAIGETCPNKDNGKIEITTDLVQNYKATFNDQEFNFTENLTIENIIPNTYELCIKAENDAIAKCFNLEVKEANEITLKSNIKSNKLIVNIEKGTAPFRVAINNNEIYKTYSKSFSIDVNNGDVVQVKTDKACEGIMEENIDLYDGTFAIPNPSDGLIDIYVPTKKESVQINLYNLQSQLISSKVYPVVSGAVHMNIKDRPFGTYFAKIVLDKTIITTKILKK